MLFTFCIMLLILKDRIETENYLWFAAIGELLVEVLVFIAWLGHVSS